MKTTLIILAAAAVAVWSLQTDAMQISVPNQGHKVQQPYVAAEGKSTIHITPSEIPKPSELSRGGLESHKSAVERYQGTRGGLESCKAAGRCSSR